MLNIKKCSDLSGSFLRLIIALEKNLTNKMRTPIYTIVIVTLTQLAYCAGIVFETTRHK